MHEAEPRTSPGGRFDMRPLLVLNALLLLVLAAVTYSSSADAQSRGRGDYTMVGGSVKGIVSNVVYIIDDRNQELVAVTLDPNTKALQGITYRNLAADAAVVTRRGRGN